MPGRAPEIAPALRDRLARNTACVASGADALRVDAGLLDELIGNEHRGRAEADRVALGFEPVTGETIAPAAPGPVVVAGLSSPWLFSRVIRACGVCRDGYRPRVMVIEPDPVRCGTALACVDIPRDAVVSVFTGDRAAEAFADDLRGRLDEALPSAAVGLPADSDLLARVDGALKAAWAEQVRELERARGEVESDRAGRDLGWWAARYGDALQGGSPLRVMLVSSRYSTFVRHAAARLADAIQAAGHDARLLIEPEDCVKFSAVAGVRMHASFDPDLVVSINWPRPVLASSWPAGVPSVCWIQDAMPHLFDRTVGEAFGPLDFVTGQVHGSLARDFAYPVTNRLFAPVPGCGTVFDRKETVPDDRFGCDVAYVSHQSETVEAFVDRIVAASASASETVRVLRSLAPRVIGAVSEARLGVTPDLWTLTSETVTEIAGRLPDRGALDRLYLHFVLPLGERAFRHETLRWAMRACDAGGWTMRVFGNGWDDHPDFRRVAGPGIEYGEDLRRAYAAAGCHLHASLQTNAHQRVFECALAGGVMLRRAPSPDRSVIQTETARMLDGRHPVLGLPGGGAVLHDEPAHGDGRTDLAVGDRFRACVPGEVRVDDAGERGRRVVLPPAFTALRPLWVPEQSLAFYPDWDFETARETMFWSQDELASCIERAVGDRAWRERVTADQRSRTRVNNSFGGFWRRLSGFVQTRLAEQAEDDPAAAAPTIGGTLGRNLAALEEIAPDIAAEMGARARRGVIRAPAAPLLAGASEAVADALASEQVIALHGVGDGEVLRALLDRPENLNGRRTAVHVVEPDLDRLLAAFAVIDLSAADGPILGGDVEWYLGEDWERSAGERLADRPMLPVPRRVVRPDPAASIPETIWTRICARFEAEQRALLGAVDAWASSRDDRESFLAMRGEGGRRPRILILTSRFTTVLRHSAAAAAAALGELGWEVETLCEDRDHERVTLRAAYRTLDAFRPDIVFAIDHHRSSFPGLPKSVPFACWIQDDLDALTSADAAASLGPTDFAIGAWMHRYIQQWGYPDEACVGMPRLTAARPPRDAGDRFAGIDLCYVSGYSGEPRSVRDELLAGLDDHASNSAVGPVCDRLLDLYRAGGTVTLPREIAEMLANASGDPGLAAPGEPWLSSTAELIQHRLNNTLYRQQGLAWAADFADEMGLTLAVFGKGWDRHPRFARYARGVVPYGEALATLTANAAITLRLEPYPPTAHQRLLDALASGGFVLSRSYGFWHEAEHAFVGMFLEHLAGRATTVAEAEPLLPGDSLAGFRGCCETLRGAFGLASDDEVVARYAYRHRNRLLDDYRHSPLPPAYFETVFSDKESFRAIADRFLSDPGGRARLRDLQSGFVRERYGYRSGLETAMREIAARLLGRHDRSQGSEAAA